MGEEGRQAVTLRTFVTRIACANDVSYETYMSHRRHYWVLVAIGAVITTASVYQWWGWWSLLSLVAVPAIYSVVEVLAISPPWLATCRVKAGAALLGTVSAFFCTDAQVSSTEYYKFAGGVVPVLLLAIILERRQEYWSTDTFAERFLTFMNVIGLMIGGGVVLRVLADDDATRGDARLVISPIVFTLISLLLALVTRRLQEEDQPTSA